MNPAAAESRLSWLIVALPAATFCESVGTAGWLVLSLLAVCATAGLLQHALRQSVSPAAALAVVAVVATGIACAMALAGAALLPAPADAPSAALWLVAASGVLFASGLEADARATWRSVLVEAGMTAAAAACIAIPVAIARPWLVPDARPAAIFVLAGAGLALVAARRRPPARDAEESTT